MKIINSTNNKEIKEIIEKKAKYQKVMILFEDETPLDLLNQTIENIKDLCIFNKNNINSLVKEEINNGYKAIVYIIKPESYNKLNINFDEYVNIVIAQDSFLLPFYLNEKSNISPNENYILVENLDLNIQMLSSLYFNHCFNYLTSLINAKPTNHYFSIFNEEVSPCNILNILKNLEEDFFFLDINIIKHNELQIESLLQLDIILINAFMILFKSIKEGNLMLVDTYKVAKENYVMIEKFYKLYFNENFYQLITLNYNCIMSFLEKTKIKIKELLTISNNKNYTEEIYKVLKEYAKNDSGLVGYLYLYNIFD